jgi:hypothetical protein
MTKKNIFGGELKLKALGHALSCLRKSYLSNTNDNILINIQTVNPHSVFQWQGNFSDAVLLKG